MVMRIVMVMVFVVGGNSSHRSYRLPRVVVVMKGDLPSLVTPLNGSLSIFIQCRYSACNHGGFPDSLNPLA